MVWSDFTRENLKLFSEFKYSLDNNNSLVKYIKNERTNIINFIKKKSFLINIYKIEEYKDIYKFVNAKFVDTKN
jgi:hypothetical protein